MKELEYILELIDELLNSDYSIIMCDNYINIIIENLKQIYSVTFNKELSEYVLNNAICYYFTNFMPYRSYSDIRYRYNVSYVDKKQIQYLKQIPQSNQRTEEWYYSRYNMITASNAWKALEKGRILDSFIYEKCLPLNLEKYNTVNINSPMYWGQLFEDVSIKIYEWKYDTKVDDFGCIKDSTYNFLGASPDGININENSPLFGRMLEIKNIVNREITGLPKKEYWVQMQMQMNICNLNECDFLETKFIEYKTYNEFINDGTFNYTKDGKIKGIIMIYLDNGIPQHEYLPLFSSEKCYIEWESNIIEKYKDKVWLKNIYWKLDVISCVLVLRNKQWYSQVLPVFKNVWNIVIKERCDGYEHRAPKRQKKKKTHFNTCVLKHNFNNIINVETEKL